MPNRELDPRLNPLPSRLTDVFITNPIVVKAAGLLPIPTFKGIAPPAVDHYIANWIVSGQLNYPEHLRAQIEADNRREENTGYFLDWVKRHFGVQFIYYPMCGWHTTPMYIFGENNTVYLANDDKHRYLQDIGTGLRVKADAVTSPFPDHAFDAVFLRFSDRDFNKDIIPSFSAELRRVVKEDGLFILDLKELGRLAKYWENELQPADLPDDNVRKIIRGYFSLLVNRDREKKKKGLLQTLFPRETGK